MKEHSVALGDMFFQYDKYGQCHLLRNSSAFVFFGEQRVLWRSLLIGFADNSKKDNIAPARWFNVKMKTN